MFVVALSSNERNCVNERPATLKVELKSQAHCFLYFTTSKIRPFFLRFQIEIKKFYSL